MSFAKIHTIFLASCLTFLLLLFAGGGLLVLAAGTIDPKSATTNTWQQYDTNIQEKYSPRIQTHQSRLQELQAELQQHQQEFVDHQKENTEEEKALQQLQTRLSTLKGQLEYLNDAFQLTERKIVSIENQIAVRESSLNKVLEEKQNIAVEADSQRDIVMSYFTLLQVDADSLAPSDLTSGLRVILSADSFSKNLREEMHFNALEQTARQVFHDLEGSMSQLEEADLLFSREKGELEQLRDTLQEERTTLVQQKSSQQQILNETQGEEERFKILFAESQQQMQDSTDQIAAAQKDIQTVQENLKLLQTKKTTAKKQLSQAEIHALLDSVSPDGTSTTTPDFGAGDQFAAEEQEKKPLNWPVPSPKITTPFRDPEYVKLFHMEHNAIDIRAAQGTPIAAPAPGYVYKVADNGMGYSYIILIHKDNLMTVYGHVSEIDVKEGQLVQAGDIIGKSGATPGTKGAGLQTTGPHLHFEVWKDGKAVNPLDYLPLSALPPEDLPKDYLEKL